MIFTSTYSVDLSIWKWRHFEGNCGHFTLIRVKPALTVLVLPAGDYVHSVSQEERMVGSTAHINNFTSLQNIESFHTDRNRYNIWLWLNSELAKLIISPSENSSCCLWMGRFKVWTLSNPSHGYCKVFSARNSLNLVRFKLLNKTRRASSGIKRELHS